MCFSGTASLPISSFSFVSFSVSLRSQPRSLPCLVPTALQQAHSISPLKRAPLSRKRYAEWQTLHRLWQRATPRHNAKANIPRRCIVRSSLLPIAPWWVCGLGAAPTDTIEQNRKTARFGDSVDPNQGYLILAVQPVGGTKLQKTRSVHDARTPAKMRRYNHA